MSATGPGRCPARCLLTAVAFVVALTGVAGAQDSVKRARAEFQKGVRAAERGDYTLALRHYQESNRIHPHPRTLYNLAAVAEHLQREEEAYEAYQSFISSATAHEGDLLPEARRKVAELALRLQAMLALTSSPAGARIFVDGNSNPVGTTPHRLPLTPGSHVLLLDVDGHRRATITVLIKPNIDASKHVTLEGLGEVRLRASTEVAVEVDGKPAGTVHDRALRREVIAGEHQIVARRAGFVDLDQRVTVGTGESLDIELAMNRPRSRASKILWPSMFGAGAAAVAVGAIGWGIPAARLDGGTVDEQREADDKATVFDLFWIPGAVACATAVTGWVLTRPSPSHARIERTNAAAR